MFRVEADLLRQAAVMRRDRIVSKPFAQRARRPLRHLPRVDENQRCLVLADQLREAVVVLLPHLVRHDRIERRAGNLNCQVDLAAMPFVDDSDVIVASADEKARDVSDWLLSGGEADPLEAATAGADLKVRLYDCFEPLQRQREVRAATA